MERTRVELPQNVVCGDKEVNMADVIEALGMHVHDDYKKDGYKYVSVFLHPGWRAEHRVDGMRSVIFDETSRQRMIVYAAGYVGKRSRKEKPTTVIIPRYEFNESDEGSDIRYRVFDNKAGNMISWPAPLPKGSAAAKRKKKELLEWLDKNWPDNHSPFAYWGQLAQLEKKEAEA